MLSGVLLFFPVTSLLGALISIGVLSHICALNFCYDVPVKLFSLHLLCMGIFLAAGDAGRLAALFLQNRAVRNHRVKRCSSARSCSAWRSL